MAYVVTQHCVDCKYTDCVSVCPVDAFHEADRILVINPDTCVNCDACVPACPVEAIYAEENLPPEYESYLKFNAEQSETMPVINTQKDPLPTKRTLDELKAETAEGKKPENWSV